MGLGGHVRRYLAQLLFNLSRVIVRCVIVFDDESFASSVSIAVHVDVLIHQVLTLVGCLGHFQAATHHAHTASIEVALKVDPLVCLTVQRLAIKLILTDKLLVIRLLIGYLFLAARPEIIRCFSLAVGVLLLGKRIFQDLIYVVDAIVRPFLLGDGPLASGTESATRERAHQLLLLWLCDDGLALSVRRWHHDSVRDFDENTLNQRE